MGANESNLSGAAWGYDMVCAVTQDAINASMLELLSASNTELSAYYLIDDNSNPVPISRDDLLKKTGGVDPFSVPNGTDQSDSRMQKLNDVGFYFALKAKMGIPSGLAPTDVPDVIILNPAVTGVSNQVTYQLFCAEFSVVVMNYRPRGRYDITNVAQSGTSPWLFVFHVNMNLDPAKQSDFGKLPEGAQKRIKNLDPNQMFSVRQLLLDVSTKGLQSLPTISGVDPSNPAYEPLTRTFIDTYWKNLAPCNTILLGYSVTPSNLNLQISPSIVPTDLNFEIDQYSVASKPGLNTLNYLVMSNNSKMPPAVPFSWDWVTADEEASFHGVMAIRRNIFGAFLAQLIQPYCGVLSIDTTISMTHSGEKFTITLSAPHSPTPAQWTLTAPGTAAGSDGFTPLLTIAYSHSSYDSSEAASHMRSINGDFNYTLSGDISVSGSVIRLTIHIVAYCEFNLHVIAIKSANFQGNIVDLTSVVTYTMATTSDGIMGVTMSPSNPAPIDRSQDIDVSFWDHLIGLDGVADYIRSTRSWLTQRLTDVVSSIDNQVAQLLNGSGAWVYPGGKTFFFKDVEFSSAQDLVSRVTYVDPATMPKLVSIRSTGPIATSAVSVPSAVAGGDAPRAALAPQPLDDAE
jgi:hypothetical protein